MSRPINIASIDTINIENKTTSFLYNFNKKIGNTFSVSYIDNSTTRIKGIKFAANPQKEDVVVRFNGTDYIFHAFILTKDIDDSDNDYGIIIELYSINYTDTLFLQFPTSIESKKSDIDTMISKLDNDTADNIDGDTNEVYSVSEININPNTWFPTDETYEFYTLDDKNITFVMFNQQMRMTSDSKDILDTRFTTSFSSPYPTTSTTTLPIFRSTESPKQMNIPDAEFQDIYIECSPEGDNVIRPQKVFTIRKLFDFGNNKESFVSNVEGFDADNIPEISRQFGIFLVGMVIFVIVYFMVNPEQIPNIVSDIIKDSTYFKFQKTDNAFIYTIYFLTVFIALCSLLFLLRDKPEIEDYKTRFGALEIKNLPLVYFISILFGVLFLVAYFGSFDDRKTESKQFGELLKILGVFGIVGIRGIFLRIGFIMMGALIIALCIAALGVGLGLLVGAAICGLIFYIIFCIGKIIYDCTHKDNFSVYYYFGTYTNDCPRIPRDSKPRGSFLDLIIDNREHVIRFLTALFIYGFIYASTYFLLFLTNHTRNLKSIAVFSLFISCLCYVHLLLKSLYDFFIPEDKKDNIEIAANVAAVAATQNPNKT